LLDRIYNMGVLETITGPLGEQISQRGAGIVIAAGFAAFLVLAVVLNVLSQLLFRNPNEPPVVFHWFPLLGNTVVYGMDPYGFFFDCRAKVSSEYHTVQNKADRFLVWRYLHVYFAGKEDDGIPW
jgi:sterol 14-demethylase